jgi:hypothetical protein
VRFWGVPAVPRQPPALRHDHRIARREQRARCVAVPVIGSSIAEHTVQAQNYPAGHVCCGSASVAGRASFIPPNAGEALLRYPHHSVAFIRLNWVYPAETED